MEPNPSSFTVYFDISGSFIEQAMTPLFDADAFRGSLVSACKTRAMSLIRGPDADARLIYIRQDLSAWSDESKARHLLDLTDEEIAWAQDGLEHPDPQDEDFVDEARYWRHIHGLTAWLDGGPHPLDLLAHRATGYRRANADPDLSNQRVSINGQMAVVTQARHALLVSDPGLTALAAADPTSAMRAWRSELDMAWREAEFDQAIFFCQDALPPIAARAPLMARRRRDGSWIFEHPLASGWLCMMESDGRRALSEEFFHNGRDVVELGDNPAQGSGADEGWFD